MGALANLVDFVFGKDVVLDQEVFQKSANDFRQLSAELENLRTDIEQMLDTLQTGFDTPAGRKLVNSCKSRILQSLKDQQLVMDHVANNLELSKNKYQPLFDDYQQLNIEIKNLGN